MARPIGPGHDCVADYTYVNANVRLSSASGFIGTTSGSITVAPGDWQVCFTSIQAVVITAPLPLTIV